MKHDLRTITKKNKSMALRLRRKARIRKIVVGSKDRPRLSVFKSAKHIYVQAIDDAGAKTLASAGSLDASIKDKVAGMKKIEVAKLIGKTIAEKLKAHDLSVAVFDRNGFRYTGRIAALADGMREAGLTI